VPWVTICAYGANVILRRHVTDNKLLSPWQCGGFPRQEAHTPVLLEELTWEITRTSHRPLLQMDFMTELFQVYQVW
jgi:hypothetical protein